MTTITWNQSAPLERATGESRKANQALRDYAGMGSGRSQRKLIEYYEGQTVSDQLAKPPTLIYSTLSRWSYQFDWVARVNAWTAIQQEQDEIEWSERRRQVREDDWKLADRLRGLANEILDAAPTFYRRKSKLEIGEVVNGVRVDTKVITVALDGNLMTRVVKVASELGRLAAEVQPPLTRSQNLNIDLSQLTTEQLERIAAGEDPIRVIATTGTGDTRTA